MTDRDPHLAQLLDQLNPPLALAPDWNDSLERSRAEAPPRRRGHRWRIPVLVAGVTIVLVGVLLVLSPWHRGPSIVDLASAALTPTRGTIVYEYIHETSTNLHTGITHRGTRKLWIASDGRFRSVQRVPGQPTLEQGRLHTGLPLLTRTGTSKSIEAVCGSGIAPKDPVQLIRRDLRKGTLQALGRTQIIHRDAQLLEYTTPSETDYLYVSPTTYYPIELKARTTNHGDVTLNTITFLAYQYLPATTTNMKLANIKAANPDAHLTNISNYDTPC